MIEQIAAFFTIEMIYLWLNIGVIPFWLILIVFPQSKICGLLVTSVFPFFVLTAVYIYLGYYFYTSGTFVNGRRYCRNCLYWVVIH